MTIKVTMYAFIIVVSVAITLKLLFMSFSLYFTLKYNSKKVGKTFLLIVT